MPVNVQEFSLAELRFSELILENGLKFDVREKWDTRNPKFFRFLNTIDDKNIVASIIEETRENYAILYWENENLVILDVGKKTVAVGIASKDRVGPFEIIGNLKKAFEPEPDLTDGKIKVRFWYATNSGPRNVSRTISVPAWKNIQNNYEENTADQLRYLVEDFHGTTGGQLIIMSGVPGTGKSYFLRALLYSWRDWCTAEYILDPENLFGGAQGYMADVVLRDSYDEETEEMGDDSGKWKLLILEDSGELLVEDAKEHTGQGLSRLLNLVDGLIGQGLRVLVMITTNEEFTKLHPAVSRDGRCAASIEFRAFSREKASKWMNGSAPKLPDGKDKFTLAELFALTKGTTVKKLEKESAKFGFRVP